ncbi:MAG: hypothetical protein QM758_05385 [Armatimonas sp.]
MNLWEPFAQIAAEKGINWLANQNYWNARALMCSLSKKEEEIRISISPLLKISLETNHLILLQNPKEMRLVLSEALLSISNLQNLTLTSLNSS